MPKKQPKQTIAQLVNRTDFPHIRDSQGKWLLRGAAPKLKPGHSFDRLCFYGEQLRKLGMKDTEISCMFSDLYWDAVSEYGLNKQVNAKTKGKPVATQKALLKIWSVNDLLTYENPDRKKITIDSKNATCTLNFDYPYEVDLDRIKTESNLLGWVRQLAGKPWMTADRLKLFIDVVSKHKGFKSRP